MVKGKAARKLKIEVNWHPVHDIPPLWHQLWRRLLDSPDDDKESTEAGDGKCTGEEN